LALRVATAQLLADSDFAHEPGMPELRISRTLVSSPEPWRALREVGPLLGAPIPSRRRVLGRQRVEAVDVLSVAGDSGLAPSPPSASFAAGTSIARIDLGTARLPFQLL
jgi:hypothetical protein